MEEKKKISIGCRLSACASLVRKGAVAADIGTDHGKLPVYLVENSVCEKAIASDIAKKPYEGAVSFVKEHGLEDKIDVRLGAGLEKIAPDEVSDIVIAGMGGELIVQILEEAPWTKNEKYNLILQPMSKASILRSWLIMNGFPIISETAVTDSGRDYTIINSTYTGEERIPTQTEVYVGKLVPCQNDSARRILKKQAKMLEDQLKGVMKQNDLYLGEQMGMIIGTLIELSEG